MEILMFLAGGIVVMILMCLTSAETINQYEEDLNTQIRLRRNRDKLIETYESRMNDLKQTNTEQRTTIEEQENLLNIIATKTTSNTYGNAQVVLDNINELVRDYQSTN